MSQKKFTILIVDDDPLNLKLLNAKLQSEPYNIILALDGAVALDKVKTELSDIILLDVMMPKMDGWGVTKRLKGNPETKDIPIIFITALDSMGDKIKGLDLGADDYLIKPVNKYELRAGVKTLIKKKVYLDMLSEE